MKKRISTEIKRNYFVFFNPKCEVWKRNYIGVKHCIYVIKVVAKSPDLRCDGSHLMSSMDIILSRQSVWSSRVRVRVESRNLRKDSFECASAHRQQMVSCNFVFMQWLWYQRLVAHTFTFLSP